MRIALVNPWDWLRGGMDKVVLNIREALLQQGHSCEIFALHDSEHNIPGPYQPLLPKENDIHGYTVQWGNPKALWRDTRKMFYNPYTAQSLRRFLSLYRADIVHVHGLSRAMSPSVYDAVKAEKIPLIQTHHYCKVTCPTNHLLKSGKTYCHDQPCKSGNAMHCVTHRCQDGSYVKSMVAALEFAWNRQRYLHQPDLHLAPSQYVYDLLQTSGIRENTIRCHFNYVDTDKFTLAELPSQGYYLYFGRLLREKGLIDLIDAFAPLTHLKLIMAGDGPLGDYCRQRIQQEGLTHIQVLPQQSQDKLIPLIQGAKATILPPLWGEIFGLTVVESFACGKPVIGSNLGGIPELIDDHVDGILINPGDAQEIREAVLQMQQYSPTHLYHIAHYARQKAIMRFSFQRHMDELMVIYHDMAPQSACKTQEVAYAS